MVCLLGVGLFVWFISLRWVVIDVNLQFVAWQGVGCCIGVWCFGLIFWLWVVLLVARWG